MKNTIPSVCMYGLQCFENSSIFLKLSGLNCCNGIKVNYSKKKGRQFLCNLYNFHALKQEIKQKRPKPTQFLRYKRKIIWIKDIWMNNPGRVYEKNPPVGLCSPVSNSTLALPLSSENRNKNHNRTTVGKTK